MQLEDLPLKASRHTFGGVSNIVCSSLMRFDDPLTRKVPSTSVPTGSKRDGVGQYGVASAIGFSYHAP